MLLAVLSLGLCVPSASAGPAATRPVKFKPYTFGAVRDGFLGAARPRNRILIARTRAQALRWDESIWRHYTWAPQAANFVTGAVIGVFLLDRPASDIQGVVVTSLSVSDGTLFLTLAVSPSPVVLHGPDPDGTPLAYFTLPGPPSARYHAFTLVSVPRAAVAHVRRVVVAHEVYDPNPLVVDVPILPHY
jgi:hypothetical protein